PVIELPDERLALIYQLGRNVLAQTAADGVNERRLGLLHPQRHRCTPFDRPNTAAARETSSATVDLPAYRTGNRLGHRRSTRRPRRARSATVRNPSVQPAEQQTPEASKR